MTTQKDIHFISENTEPFEMKGMYFKMNGMVYQLTDLIGFGEHRFVFSLKNTNDNSELFNLLVLRKKNSREAILNENGLNLPNHKKMKIYFLEGTIFAIRERKESLQIQNNVSIKAFHLYNNKKYDKCIEFLLQKQTLSSYESFLLALCYKTLGNLNLFDKYMSIAEEKESNFDFKNLCNSLFYENNGQM